MKMKLSTYKLGYRDTRKHIISRRKERRGSKQNSKPKSHLVRRGSVMMFKGGMLILEVIVDDWNGSVRTSFIADAASTFDEVTKLVVH